MKRTYVICGGVVAIVLLIIVVIVAVVTTKSDDGDSVVSSSTYYTSCSDSHDNILASYASAAVSSDANPCAAIAVDVLQRGGTAADAAVAGMFCVGILNAQSCGIGGGFVATYYSKVEGKVYSLDARETAPGAAYEEMYDPEVNLALKEKKGKWWEKKEKASFKGGLSVAVPGEVSGLHELYQRFGGKIPWSELLEPSINICEQGYNLTWYTGGIVQLVEKDIRAEPSMSEILISANGSLLKEGDLVKRPQLAKTLRVLQKEPYALQNGSLVRDFVDDIRGFGGIITEEDLLNYRPKWKDPATVYLQNGGYVLHSFPPPGSGAILGLIMNILDEFNLQKEDLENQELVTYQRIVEAFKYAYARRYELGDLSDKETKKVLEELLSESLAHSLKNSISDAKTFQDASHYGADIYPADDQGTAHFSLVAPNGDAVSITSSINFAFGAGIRSMKTGIILNDQMADFSTPESSKGIPGSIKPNKKNFIHPGKRPLSSMSPSIVLDNKGDVRLCFGAAGGTLIISASAWVAARYLWMGENLKEAMDSCRLHHQLEPMSIAYEPGFPENLREGLEKKGHKTNTVRWKSVVEAVGREPSGNLVASTDFRKSGQLDGF